MKILLVRENCELFFSEFSIMVLCFYNFLKHFKDGYPILKCLCQIKGKPEGQTPFLGLSSDIQFTKCSYLIYHDRQKDLLLFLHYWMTDIEPLDG